jgi:hypothetical protein
MLHTWEAERLEGVLLSGRTKPLIVECAKFEPAAQTETEAEDPSAPTLERRLMVIKALGLPEVTECGLFNEVFGNLLAREMGINTPSPGLAHLSLDFVNATSAALSRYNLHVAPGLAAGSEHFHGGFSNVVVQSLSAGEILQASLIYAFDLLVQNPDRTPLRPNCGSRSGTIMVYDFETAFSFLFLIGDQREPWQVSQHGIAPNHLFFNVLRQRKAEVTWEPILNRIRHLSSEGLEEMTATLPPDWRQRCKEIENHIINVRRNLNKFELELQRSLS